MSKFVAPISVDNRYGSFDRCRTSTGGAKLLIFDAGGG